MEQDLTLRIMTDKLEETYHDNKKEIITLILALQKQNFVMGNSLTNLIKHWPHEEIVFVGPSQGIPI